MTPTDTPPPTTEQGWIFHSINVLREEMIGQHKRLRDDMNAGFNSLRDEMRGQNARISDHSDRLTVIETERALEARLALRRGAWAGIATSAGLTAFISGMKWFLGR